MDLKDIARVVGKTGDKLWYRMAISEAAMVRVRELSVGGVGPDWRYAPTPNVSIQGVLIETPDPEWFDELDVRTRQALGRHSGR